MTFDPAHTSTLAELARVQRERDELRRAGAALLETLGGLIQRTYPEATLLASLIPEFTKQDPGLDAEEDRLYAEAAASATARMEAAEAREDAADARTERGRKFFDPG